MKLITILALIFSFISCSEKLSKAEALEAINADIPLSFHCIQGFDTSISSDILGGKLYSKKLKEIKKLEADGFLVSKTRKVKSMLGTYEKTSLALDTQLLLEYTRSEKQFRNNQVIIATAAISSIDAISMDNKDNEATVRYTYSYEPNLLYSFVTVGNPNRQCPLLTEFDGEIVLQKFDTGWAVKKMDTARNSGLY